MDDKKRARLAIILAFAVFAIVPLLIGIIVLMVQINSRVSEKDALYTSISNEMAQVIAEESGIDLDKVAMHGIVSDGDWGIVGVFSKDTMFGDAMLVLLHKENGKYEVVGVGDGLDESYLSELGAPSNLGKKLRDNKKIEEYTSALYNSKMNPRNKYPLIQKLPYKSDDLRVSYYFKDDLVDEEGIAIPIITIRGVDAAERKRAFRLIEDYGYDLGSYRIEFINFNNAFAEEEEMNSSEVGDGEDEEGP